jgi:hypothetical protein
MSKMKCRVLILTLLAISLFFPTPAVYCQSGVEISTEQFKPILAGGKAHVFDVRPASEFTISHIPGSMNIYENEIERHSFARKGHLRLCSTVMALAATKASG